VSNPVATIVERVRVMQGPQYSNWQPVASGRPKSQLSTAYPEKVFFIPSSSRSSAADYFNDSGKCGSTSCDRMRMRWCVRSSISSRQHQQ